MTDLDSATKLLQEIIRIPSLSRQERDVADHLEQFLTRQKIEVERIQQNIVAKSKNYHPDKPNVLLCSHYDTVKANAGYTRDPHDGAIEGNQLFGLGSNDAGGPLVCLVLTFKKLYERDLPFNLWLAAVAEEEISGSAGAALVTKHVPPMQLAIVGEPTSLRMAIAEKGLMVIDGYATGIPGHAAHGNSLNPIYQASKDILTLKNLSFDRTSHTLGDTRLTVSQINAGTQHNQVPAECHFVIDVRVNEQYTNEEVFNILQTHTVSLLKARSYRLNSSGIEPNHPILQVAQALQLETYGSATLSDQALLPYPSIKIGPGDTKRSHSANEFIYLSELADGLKNYMDIITHISF